MVVCGSVYETRGIIRLVEPLLKMFLAHPDFLTDDLVLTGRGMTLMPIDKPLDRLPGRGDVCGHSWRERHLCPLPSLFHPSRVRSIVKIIVTQSLHKFIVRFMAAALPERLPIKQ